MKKPTGARLPPLPAPSAKQRQHAQNFLSISGSPKFFKILGVVLTKNSERTEKSQTPPLLSTNTARPRGRRLRKTKHIISWLFCRNCCRLSDSFRRLSDSLYLVLCSSLDCLLILISNQLKHLTLCISLSTH